jgi:high affinity Mn2+ porin
VFTQLTPQSEILMKSTPRLALAKHIKHIGQPARSLLFTALACAGSWAAAAEPEHRANSKHANSSTLQKLLQRVEQLEQRNQLLERRMQSLSTAPFAPTSAPFSSAPSTEAAPTARLQQLEAEQKNLSQQVQSLVQPVALLDDDGDERLMVEGGMVAVAQRVNAAGSAQDRREGRINYRGDLSMSLPLGYLGQARSTAVGQLRLGQGGGVALRPTHTGAVNSTTFEALAGSDQTYAVLAQAYLQLEWPLDGGRFNDQASSRVEFSAGKMDLFGFFDQNAVAGDEGAQFLNNVFVHNPLLDSGGDIGADSYGFAPGMRLGYFKEQDDWGWGASVGVFASGGGAALGGGLGRPLVIAQVEAAPKQINGEPRGNYRLYAWSNGNTTDLAGADERHSGLGLSADQRVGRGWNFFGRYGLRTQGQAPFNSALTLGFERGGAAWGRRLDTAGLAVGWMKTSSAWRRATADTSLAGYSAAGHEQVAEAYYRIKLNNHLEISPHLQWLRRPGGDADAQAVKVVGLRATLGF